jgi:DNA polymerase I-like protein with 3'-5' exonuclease and polymerase domains
MARMLLQVHDELIFEGRHGRLNMRYRRKPSMAESIRGPHSGAD